MKQFVNPTNLCAICGVSRTEKGSDHSKCSKLLQQKPQKKANAGNRYKTQNPVLYWEDK